MLPNVNVTNRALFLESYGVLVGQIEQGDCLTFDPDSASYGLVQSTTDQDNVSWRLGLDWFVVHDTLLYASLAQGYKAGNTPVNAANISTQNAPVGQEKLLAYELGIKTTLLDQRMQLNAALFYYDYDDKQLSVYFADPIYTVLGRLANIPKSEAYGLDTELTWRLSKSITAIAAGTLLHTEVQDYQGIDETGAPMDFDGADFLYSPEASGSLTLLYNRPISNALGFSANLNGRYQSSSKGDLADSEFSGIDAYGTLNGGIGIHSLDERWEVSLWGANLTDEYYWVATTQNANTWVRLPGKSRTYGMTFTYRL
jgi:outer membrane receptor protein involved in Fe transport